MQIQNIGKPQLSSTEGTNSSTYSSTEFSAVYKHQALIVADPVKQSLSTKAPDIRSSRQENGTKVTADRINLGALSKKNSTIAHLLLSNPDLKAETWSIIHNPINKNKVFTQIPLGSQIFYNKQSGELSWHTNSQNKSIPAKNPLKSQLLNQSEAAISSSHNSSSNKVSLGIINSNASTVSKLLSNNNDYKSELWNIIHSTINKDKPFTKIPSGSTIYIDSKTKEISWSVPENKLSKTSQISTTDSNLNTIISSKLDDAVKPFMGTAYKNLDCYTLVVNGLKNMGVSYRGKNGLSGQLLQMARAEGRVENAYFTGEGITRAMGEKVYSKAIIRVDNINQQSKAIYQEMKNLMQKGDILSFSLESKGHTGIISHNQDQWTYINSGRLDHSINKNAPKHGVGEENLQDEISNWIKLAQRRKESLKITIGRLDSNKLA